MFSFYAYSFIALQIILKAKRKRPPPHASLQSKLSSQDSFLSFYKLTSKDTAQTDKC